MRVFPLLFFVAMLASAGLRGQSYLLRLHSVDASDSMLQAVLKPAPSYNDQLAALDYAQRIVPLLQEQGFLAASVDSFAVNDKYYDAWVYMGQRWRWASISLKALPPALLTSTGISEQQYTGRPLTGSALSSLSDRILVWYENNGYPFARAGLDSISDYANGGISARLSVDPGPLTRVDSIVAEGDARLTKAYLMRYLDVRQGALYNESQIQKVGMRLRELPFLHESSSWRISFKPGETKLLLDLKERRVNLLNGIFGLQPNTLETGKFLLTIDAQAAFQNILGNGESFSFSYQNLQAKSPRIKAEAMYPYLFGSALGVDAHFDLYFRGTQFRRTSFDIGGRYALSPQDFLRVYYRGYSNRVISPDTAYILTYRRLPDNIDINSGGGGLEVQTFRTDNRLNPAKGWTLRLAGEALKRVVRKNDGITGIRDGSGFDFSKLYDSVSEANYQYRLSGDAAYYFHLAKRIVLKTAYAGGWMSGQRLFQNEMYQLGGFRLLRGFDEGSLFVSQYHIVTGELRLLLGRTSNIYLFSDNGWLESRINGFTNEGIYNGFGVGTTLETKSGVFTIAYALGRGPGNPIQFRQSKIHIGFAAYF